MADKRAAKTSVAKILRDMKIPMRDAIFLAADVYLPRTDSTTISTILLRTPYGKNDVTEQAAPLAKFLVTQGFAVVVQDIRGTGVSEGVFKPYSNVEGPDGYDTLEWLTQQVWCNGNIGTVGCSYHGEVQDMLAAECHPAHKAAFIEGAYTYNNGGMRAFSFVRYGAIELAYAMGGNHDLLKTLPLADIKAKAEGQSVSYYANHWPETVHAWLTEPPASEHWLDDGGVHDDAPFNVPAIHMNEWYSVPFSSLKMFELFRTNAQSQLAQDNQFLIMSPMTHCRTSAATQNTTVGERGMGDARIDYFGIMVDWFDYWLNDIENSITKMPKVQTYLMGKNVWQHAEVWPLPGTETIPFYLDQSGALLCDLPEQDGAHEFSYDPEDPVPSVGGPVNMNPVLRAGGYDQCKVEVRDDVLVFSTSTLQRPIQVSGLIEVELYVSSDCLDTDFTAKLVDVYPDGRAFNLVEGITRMRYRKSVLAPSFMEKNKVYKISIDLDSTSNWFDIGHEIRLEISSSNFPRFDRNLNTGEDNARTAEFKIANNRVHTGRGYPSCVMLPVVGTELHGR